MNIQKVDKVEVVGTDHDGRAVNHRGLSFGQELVMEHEKDNPYDPNAVLVLTKDGRQLGHLSKGFASEYAPAIDSGKYSFTVTAARAEYDPERPILIVRITAEELSRGEDPDGEDVERRVREFLADLYNDYRRENDDYLGFISSESVDTAELIRALDRVRLTRRLCALSADIFAKYGIGKDDGEDHEDDARAPFTKEELINTVGRLSADIGRVLSDIRERISETLEIDDDEKYYETGRALREKRKNFRALESLFSRYREVLSSFTEIADMHGETAQKNPPDEAASGAVGGAAGTRGGGENAAAVTSDESGADSEPVGGAAESQGGENAQTSGTPALTPQTRPPEPKSVPHEPINPVTPGVAVLPVDLDEPRRYSFHKPYSFTFRGQKYFVKTWRDIYRKFLVLLYNDGKYHDIIRSLAGKSLYGRRIDFTDGDHSGELIVPFRIGDDLYAEANLSASDILNRVKKLKDMLNIGDGELLIDYVADGGEIRERTERSGGNTRMGRHSKPFSLRDTVIALLSSDDPEIRAKKLYNGGMTARTISTLIEQRYERKVDYTELLDMLRNDSAFTEPENRFFALAPGYGGESARYGGAVTSDEDGATSEPVGVTETQSGGENARTDGGEKTRTDGGEKTRTRELSAEAFVKWLESEGVSHSTAKQYLSGVRSCEKMYKDIFGEEKKLIGAASAEDIKETIGKLIGRREYESLYYTKKNGYTAALAKFIKFAEDGGGTAAQKNPQGGAAYGAVGGVTETQSGGEGAQSEGRFSAEAFLKWLESEGVSHSTANTYLSNIHSCERKYRELFGENVKLIDAASSEDIKNTIERLLGDGDFVKLTETRTNFAVALNKFARFAGVEIDKTAGGAAAQGGVTETQGGESAQSEGRFSAEAFLKWLESEGVSHQTASGYLYCIRICERKYHEIFGEETKLIDAASAEDIKNTIEKLLGDGDFVKLTETRTNYGKALGYFARFAGVGSDTAARGAETQSPQGGVTETRDGGENTRTGGGVTEIRDGGENTRTGGGVTETQGGGAVTSDEDGSGGGGKEISLDGGDTDLGELDEILRKLGIGTENGLSCSEALVRICEYAIDERPFEMATIDGQGLKLRGKDVFRRRPLSENGYSKLSNGMCVATVYSESEFKAVASEVLNYCRIGER